MNRKFKSQEEEFLFVTLFFISSEKRRRRRDGVARYSARQRIGWPAEFSHPERYRRAARGSDYQSTLRAMDYRR
jgi:hypothetical protein